MEFQGAMLGVISNLVMLLRLLELIPDFTEELIAVHQQLIHSENPS
jgi:hypothetical protein